MESHRAPQPRRAHGARVPACCVPCVATSASLALCTIHAHEVLTAYIVVQHAVHHTALLLLALRLPRALSLPAASEQAAAPGHRLRARPLLPGLRGGEPAGGHPYLTPLLASYRFLVPRGLHLEYVTTATSCFLPRPYDYLAPFR